MAKKKVSIKKVNGKFVIHEAGVPVKGESYPSLMEAEIAMTSYVHLKTHSLR